MSVVLRRILPALVCLALVARPLLAGDRPPVCFTNRHIEPTTGDVVGYTLALAFQEKRVTASLCTFQGGPDPVITVLTGTVSTNHLSVAAPGSASSVPLTLEGTIGSAVFSGRIRYNRGSTFEETSIKLKVSHAIPCCSPK